MSKQHTSPCADCPFNRKVEPGALGGSPPEVYIGQAFAGFVIPCHCTINYDDPDWKVNSLREAKQCAGATIFRANCEVEIHPLLKRGLISLPMDTDKVFASPVEFLMHHANIPRDLAERMLEMVPPQVLAMMEFRRAGAQLHLIERTE